MDCKENLELLIPPSPQPSNLDELFEMMRGNHPSVTATGFYKSDLPVFGGPEPSNTHEVRSWDSTRLIVGTCADDLMIVPREF